MIDEKKVNTLIEDAYISMEKSKAMFGKEIFQKRFKPIFEGYLTALCSVLELPEEKRTKVIKGSKE